MSAGRNERSERILHAAMHLFHERGFDGVGVDLIGERAGMSGPAIYRYFSNKDEILATLVDQAIDRVLQSTGGVCEDPRDELEHLIQGHVRRVVEERELMSVWTRERHLLTKQYRTRLRARINRYVERWVDCLDACYPGNTRDVLVTVVHALHGMIDATASWTPQQTAVEGLDVILTGLVRSSLDWLTDPPCRAALVERPDAPNRADEQVINDL